MEKFNIIVVGGHAGCEASNAAAKIDFKVAHVTANKKNIADMSSYHQSKKQ